MRVVTICFCFFCFIFMFEVVYAGSPNVFNPYLQKNLPQQELSNDGKNMAKSIGAHQSSLQDEAGHRVYFRQEAYPVVFGTATSSAEILVFIDYAKTESETVWAQVMEAVKGLNPHHCKIAVFAKNSEQYGTELMGGGIWVAYARAPYAMDYFNYTLRRWNENKRALKAQGITRPFVYEYDATATKKEFPILYTYLNLLKPTIAESEQLKIVKYAFDAGNVNMYQANLAAKEYEVASFPAVVVNGEILKNPTAQNIISAAKN